MSTPQRMLARLRMVRVEQWGQWRMSNGSYNGQRHQGQARHRRSAVGRRTGTTRTSAGWQQQRTGMARYCRHENNGPRSSRCSSREDTSSRPGHRREQCTQQQTGWRTVSRLMENVRSGAGQGVARPNAHFNTTPVTVMGPQNNNGVCSCL